MDYKSRSRESRESREAVSREVVEVVMWSHPRHFVISYT